MVMIVSKTSCRSLEQAKGIDQLSHAVSQTGPGATKRCSRGRAKRCRRGSTEVAIRRLAERVGVFRLQESSLGSIMAA